MKKLIIIAEDTIETLESDLYANAQDIWNHASDSQREEIFEQLLKLNTPSRDEVNKFISRNYQ